jgi:hypothetical protein
VDFVEMVRRGDNHALEVGNLDELVNVRADIRHRKALREGPRLRTVIVAERGDLHPAHLGEHGQVRHLREQHAVEVAPVAEATMLGAAFAAWLAVGVWSGDDEIAGTWQPARRVEPTRSLDRDRWREAVARAEEWIPELSTIEL